MRAGAIALAAMMLATGPALAQPSNSFDYDPNKIVRARMQANDEGVMQDCIDAAIQGLMPMRDRVKIKVILRKMCTTAGDGWMTPEIANAFIDHTVDEAINNFLAGGQ